MDPTDFGFKAAACPLWAKAQAVEQTSRPPQRVLFSGPSDQAYHLIHNVGARFETAIGTLPDVIELAIRASLRRVQ
jgi:hypothetical protein